jgi:hypothetical protein
MLYRLIMPGRHFAMAKKAPRLSASHRRRQGLMQAGLKRLHKYMLDIEGIDHISDEMRAVVESEWPGARSQAAVEETTRADHAPRRRPIKESPGTQRGFKDDKESLMRSGSLLMLPQGTHHARRGSRPGQVALGGSAPTRRANDGAGLATCAVSASTTSDLR